MAFDGLPISFVRLRVGGETFETSLDTVAQDRTSLLSLMLCGDIPSARDPSGALLIDRDPRRFRVLLNFLRTNQLVLEGGVDAEGIAQEAQYFMLPGAEEAAKRMMGPEKGQELLKCVVDARRGTVLRVAGGQAKCLKVRVPARATDMAAIALTQTGLLLLRTQQTVEINLLRDTFVAVDAYFSIADLTVYDGGAGRTPDGGCPWTATHDAQIARPVTTITIDGTLALGDSVQHGGPSSLRLLHRLGPGTHAIRIECSNRGEARSEYRVVGPVRVQVAQLADRVVEWEHASDVSRPAAWGREEVEGWTDGLGGDAQGVCEAVQAIAGSCVR